MTSSTVPTPPTPRSEGIRSAPPTAPVPLPPPLPVWTPVFVVKVLVTVLAALAYLGFRTEAASWLHTVWFHFTRRQLELGDAKVLANGVLFVLVLVLWRKVLFRSPRYQAPVLITAILAVADGYGILNSISSDWLKQLTGGWVDTYSPTFVTILTAVLVELAAGWFFWGKVPHLASAYISGISAGILIKSSELWPFVLCAAISILSKYVLRIGDRHLWNPTNFGITVLLFLALKTGANIGALTIEFGNEIWTVVVIWTLGLLIMYRLGRFHIPLAFLAAFVPLAFLRDAITHHGWRTEIAPMTSTMFQLYIFFMITDPPTTPRAKWGQILVAVLIAVADTVLRLAFKDVHSLYHALFIVGPIANVIEIWWTRAHARARNPVPAVLNTEGRLPSNSSAFVQGK